MTDYFLPVSTTGPASALPSTSGSRAPKGLTLPGLIIVTLLPTAVVMLASAALFSGIALFPNVVFAVVCIFGALRIRRSDLLAAVIAPPLVYAASVLIAGFAMQGKSGGLILNLGATLGEYLSVGAPWLFGVTIICFVIIVVRGRTGR